MGIHIHKNWEKFSSQKKRQRGLLQECYEILGTKPTCNGKSARKHSWNLRKKILYRKNNDVYNIPSRRKDDNSPDPITACKILQKKIVKYKLFKEEYILISFPWSNQSPFRVRENFEGFWEQKKTMV